MRTPLPDRRPSATTTVAWEGHSLQIQALTGIMDRRDGCLQHAVTPNRNGSLEDHVMASKDLPSPEVLRQLLRYEPETGKLFWLPRAVEMFPDARTCNSWNSRHAGKEAFVTLHTAGYLQGIVMRKHYYAHRVAWAIHTGAWPRKLIDHADGDPKNNRIENLRQADDFQNSRNVRSAKGSSSRYLGVYWGRHNRKWIAAITVNGRKRHIGCFGDEEEAAAAYDAAALTHFGGFARLNLDKRGAA